MAKQAVPKKLIGIILLIAGAGLAIWAFQKSEGFQSQLSNAFTGSHSDNVMMLYIGSAICIAIGVFLTVKK